MLILKRGTIETLKIFQFRLKTDTPPVTLLFKSGFCVRGGGIHVTIPNTCMPRPASFWFVHSTPCNKLCVVGVS